MSRSCRIAIAQSSVPVRKLLQAQFAQLGYPLSLDEVEPREAGGYIACILDGEDAGFTLSPDGQGVTVRWTGDPREQCAGLIFALAVMQTAQAVVLDAEGKPLAESTLKSRISDLLAEM